MAGMDAQLGWWGFDPAARMEPSPFGDVTNTFTDKKWLREDLVEDSDLKETVESLRLQFAKQLSGNLRSMPFSRPASLQILAQENRIASMESDCTSFLPSKCLVEGAMQAPFPKVRSASVDAGSYNCDQFNLWKTNSFSDSAFNAAVDLPINFQGKETMRTSTGLHIDQGYFSDLVQSGNAAASRWAQKLRSRMSSASFDGTILETTNSLNIGDSLTTGGGAAEGPSGPRRSGQGTEDAIQNIVAIDRAAPDCVVVSVTLLVSGFIIGPKGASIREIQKKTGTQIRSFNKRPSVLYPRIVRTFFIQGTREGQDMAVDILKSAVERYKYLAEGPCNGQRVSHIHTIFGTDFFYSPPPKSIVPHAAGLDPLEDCSISTKQGVNRVHESFTNVPK